MSSGVPGPDLEPAARPAGSGTRERLHDVDAIRGLSLIGMFIYHCVVAHHRLFELTHPFIFDASMVFVAVSGYMAGLVYGSRRDQPRRLLATVYRRVGVLVVAHLGLLVALAGALALDDRICGGDPALRNFVQSPAVGVGRWLAAVLTLRHQPILINCLPIYIVCLAVAPALMLTSSRVRAVLLVASWAVWLAYWKLGWIQRDALSGEVIHFSLGTWQAVFITGCVVALERERIMRWFSGRGFEVIAWSIFVGTTLWVCLPYLASMNQDQFWERQFARFGVIVDVPERIRTVTAHPVPVVAFAAAVLLWWRHRPIVLRCVATVPGRLLAMLGAHSLWIFVGGTLLCIVTAWMRFRLHIGDGPRDQGFTTRGMLIGQVVMLAGIAVQFALAWWLDRRQRLRRSQAG